MLSGGREPPLGIRGELTFAVILSIPDFLVLHLLRGMLQ